MTTVVRHNEKEEGGQGGRRGDLGGNHKVITYLNCIVWILFDSLEVRHYTLCF